MRIPFTGPSYQSASVNADAQRSINLYPEVVESETGKVRVVMYGTPGLHTFTTLPTAPVRGLWGGENRLFAVGGNTLYEITQGGGQSSRGTVANDGSNSPVQMFPNGNQLFVVSAGKGYLDDGITGPVEKIDAITGGFLDGYFLAQMPPAGVSQPGNEWRISALLDGTQWDPLDKARKETYPDSINAILVDHEDVWLFGTQTSEVWRHTGDADFPFKPVYGGFIHQGLVARWTPRSVANGVMWLGGDPRGGPVCWRAEGYQPRRVSTHAIENVWRTHTVEDAIAYTYLDNGHHFYVIQFPTPGTTWVYDVNTGMWHERFWWTGSALGRHRARCHASVWGKHYVGDWQNGNIYEQSADFYDDFGGDMRRVRTIPHLAGDNGERFFHHRFQLDMETGTFNGTEPTVELAWSDDGGHTFNSPRSAGTGAYQQFSKRVQWFRLGMSRDRVYQITQTGKSKAAWLGAFLDVTQGRN